MWNKTVDLVVVGCGAAGASAAIGAHDKGASVLVLEKMPVAGGSSRMCGGTIREILDVDEATEYFAAVNDETVSYALNRKFTEECKKNYDWFTNTLNATLIRATKVKWPPAPDVVWPFLPGTAGVGGRFLVSGEGHPENASKPAGANLMACLMDNIQKRKIEVLVNSPVKELVTNDKREVLGVLAETPQGALRVRAKKGVILTCGGFMNNREMMINYLGTMLKYQGNPGNTGDGIRMAQKLGAQLWHMLGVSCGIGYTIPGEDYVAGIGVRTSGYIYVDQFGKRFLDETGNDVHAMAHEFLHLDHQHKCYPRIPGWLIFDENTRKAGRMLGHCPGIIQDSYVWSDDNMKEVENGWLVMAYNIKELAEKTDIPPYILEETIGKYNIAACSGYDPDFGRNGYSMTPINTPPFYAAKVEPGMLNTQGGPVHNEHCQVIDVEGNVIRHLYASGELGSIFHMHYPGGANISECLGMGRHAGEYIAEYETEVSE